MQTQREGQAGWQRETGCGGSEAGLHARRNRELNNSLGAERELGIGRDQARALVPAVAAHFVHAELHGSQQEQVSARRMEERVR